MEILEILATQKEQIYPEDLDFFITELETGDYTEAYIAECKQQIALIRKWLCGEDESTSKAEEISAPLNAKAGILMDIRSIAPEAANSAAAAMSPEDIILSEIKSIRESDSYKSRFRKYIQDCGEIDTAFVDRHYSFFTQWELDVIVSVKQFDEVFLEKYFGTLDKNKISRHQCFSEGFFMKHYSQLDAEIVLTKGKNEWRKKENRSKQLDVFLRLKGVRL